MKKNKCYVCGFGFDNTIEHFDVYGNVCNFCDSFLNRIFVAHSQGDKGREDFWRSMFAKFIVHKSINS